MTTSSTSSLFFGNREVATNNNNIQPPPPQQPPHHHLNQHSSAIAPPSSSPAPPPKKKRNLPGGPSKYPDAEVITLSPKTLMATNRFICEVCSKGFQREQNLQLHRRGHNLPWKLKQKNPNDPVRKKVYLCPETSCVHHDASRALGDLTGIKKHFSRKHGEKKFKCEKCSKRYAVQSDWKAHSKTCGTREYRCDCGTLFSRRDSFITHRAFCDALAQESAKLPTSLTSLGTHMFGSSTGGGAGVGNNMGLGMGMGMGLSHQVASHLPCFSDQQMMTSESLRLGGGVRQFDHLLGTSFRPHQQQNSNFYLSNHHEQNPVRYENSSQDQNQGQLNHHLSDLQGNNNGMPPFNLGFFSGNNNNNNDTNTINSGSTGSRDHSSGLFSPGGGLFGGPTQGYNTGQVSLQQQNQSSMSATALLQEASQMGSTNSTHTATTTAAINGFQPNKPPSPPTSGGGGFGGLFFGENDQNTLNDFLLSKDTSSIYDIGGNINHSQPSSGLNNNNKYNGFNPNTKPVQGGLGSSDSLTRDFLGVGQIMRSVSGAGFTTTTRSEQHQVDGTSMANFNNNNNNNQIHHNNNNNPNNNNSNNNNNNVNYSGQTSSQSYGGGNSF